MNITIMSQRWMITVNSRQPANFGPDTQAGHSPTGRGASNGLSGPSNGSTAGSTGWKAASIASNAGSACRKRNGERRRGRPPSSFFAASRTAWGRAKNSRRRTLSLGRRDVRKKRRPPGSRPKRAASRKRPSGQRPIPPYTLVYDTAFFSFRRQNANRSPNSAENNPERMLRNK
ncbi:hypothetical protein GS458_2609 [Geobacillus stearothermophilus]|nr:hypothetical protein GS458_2609 [Geobacillus stearothermophilus]